ncbi:MAG: HAMP domain-containing protein, partial [Verrucomicrobiales bacterium]
MKIRTKFRLVSLCIVLIVVGVVAAIFLVARKEVTKKIKNHLELVADLQLDRVREVVERNFERLEQVSSRLPLQDSVVEYLDSSAEDERDTINGILADAQQAVEEFSEVSIIDPEGRVIGSSDLDRIDATLGGDSFFQERVEFSDRVEKDAGRSVTFEVIEERLVVVLSEPFMDEVGFIVIRMGGGDLAEATLGKDEVVQTMLLKKESDGGILVLTPPDRAGLVADALPDGPLMMAANGQRDFMPDVRDTFRDVPVLAVSDGLGSDGLGSNGLGLGFVATMDRSVAFEGLRKIGINSLILLGIGLLAMEVALRGISKTILQPIQRLAETANEISGGELTRRVEVVGNDEIGELGRDFNQMSERLIEANSGLERKVEERTAELEQSNAELAQFAYVASHDLKEPLRMVTSYVQLLERKLGKDLDEESKE